MNIIRIFLGQNWGLTPAELKRVLGFPATVLGAAAAIITLLSAFGWLGTFAPEETRAAWTITVFSIVGAVAIAGAYASAATLLAERLRSQANDLKRVISIKNRTVADEMVIAALETGAKPVDIDAFGADLSEFWNIACKGLEATAEGSRVRVLLLDPSFPDPRDGLCIASIRERILRTPERQMRRDVLRWHSWLSEHVGLKSRISIRLYRAIPTFRSIRFGGTIVFSPAVLHSSRRKAPTFLVQDSPDAEESTRELFKALTDHFSEVWESSRALDTVPAWELEAWRSEILLSGSR